MATKHGGPSNVLSTKPTWSTQSRGPIFRAVTRGGGVGVGIVAEEILRIKLLSLKRRPVTDERGGHCVHLTLTDTIDGLRRIRG